MKFMMSLLIYSFFGFLLERVINLIFLGSFYDNSVLVGPYQPMYGLGVVLTLVFYKHFKHIFSTLHPLVSFLLFWVIATLFTGLSEFASGSLYEAFYGDRLWDYQSTFTICNQPYVCFLPTSIFGLLALFTVIYIDPFVQRFQAKIPKTLTVILILIFIIDYIYTYWGVL
ncbi:MAG: putative ABC transporter permease [Candidatus Izemoplasmataceae bacterium]